MLDFKPVTLSDKTILNSFLQNKPPHTAEHMFTTLFAWQEPHAFRWCIYEKWLLIETTFEEVTSFFPPIGPKEDYIKPLLALDNYCKENNIKLIFTEAVARDLRLIHDAMPNRFTVQRDRGAANYIYKVPKLIKLKGKRYHQKRGHIKKFKKEAPEAKMIPLTTALIPACLETLEEWCIDHSCELFPSLAEERHAIEKLLANFGDLDYFAACIVINGKVEAFTIGEELNGNCGMIHIEKASSNYPGIYQVLNQQFLQKYFPNTAYINRAEDLGEDNLRRAKMSYYPYVLIMKYTLTDKS